MFSKIPLSGVGGACWGGAWHPFSVWVACEATRYFSDGHGPECNNPYGVLVTQYRQEQIGNTTQKVKPSYCYFPFPTELPQYPVHSILNTTTPGLLTSDISFSASPVILMPGPLPLVHNLLHPPQGYLSNVNAEWIALSPKLCQS
jgi:hypothetical protein